MSNALLPDTNKRVNLLQKSLETIAYIACNYPKTVLLIAAILTLISWIPLFTGGVRFGFSAARLLPQEVPTARAFSQALTDFDSADEAVVVFRLDPDLPEAQYLAGAAAEKLVDKLLQRPDLIKSANCHFLGNAEYDYLKNELLPSAGLLFLEPEYLQTAIDKLQSARIRTAVKRTARRLAGTFNTESMEEGLILDTLGLGSLFVDAFKAFDRKNDKKIVRDDSSVQDLLNKKSPYMVDPAETMLLVDIRPAQPAQVLDFSIMVSEFIREQTAEVVDSLPPATKHAFTVDFAGGYEIAKSYDQSVTGALFSTMLTSFIGVVVLFCWAFRRKGVLLYIGVPLLMIVSWTAGLAQLIYGQLNFISCAFAAVLIGLGVDYGIHLYNRYIQERANGLDFYPAFQLAISQTGRGIILGMLTTVMGFIALWGTRFSQLSEFGVLAALGLFLSAPAMMLLLPALLAWYGGGKEKSWRLTPVDFRIDILTAWIGRHKKLLACLGLALALAMPLSLLIYPSGPGFNSHLSNLRPEDPAFKLGIEISKAFSSRSPGRQMLLVYGEDEVTALNSSAALTPQLKNLISSGILVNFESILTILPAPVLQLERLKMLQSVDWDTAKATLIASLENEGLDTSAFQPVISLLEQHQKRAENLEPLLPSALDQSPLGRFSRRFVTERRREYRISDEIPAVYPVTLALPAKDRYTDEIVLPAGTVLESAEQVSALASQVKRITVKDRGFVVKIFVAPPVDELGIGHEPRIDDTWVAAVTKELDLPADAVGENQALTGIGMLAWALAKVVKEDFFQVSIIITILVFSALLILFRRNPIRAILCLIAIACSVCYLFLGMILTGTQFNFVNVLAVPILIGLGVDNGIHLVNRYFENNERLMSVALPEAGRAFILTTLTSVCGFGSLALSAYGGVAEMGWLTNAGLFTNLLASMVTLPAILLWFFPPQKVEHDITA